MQTQSVSCVINETIQFCLDFTTSENLLPKEFVQSKITFGLIFENISNTNAETWLNILDKTQSWRYLNDPTGILLFLTNKLNECLVPPLISPISLFPPQLIGKMRWIPCSSLLAVFSGSSNFNYSNSDIKYLFDVEDLDVSTLFMIIKSENIHITLTHYKTLCLINKYINEIIKIIPSQFIDWKSVLENNYLDVLTIFTNIGKFNYQVICNKLKGTELEQYKFNWSKYISSFVKSDIVLPQPQPTYNTIDMPLKISSREIVMSDSELTRLTQENELLRLQFSKICKK